MQKQQKYCSEVVEQVNLLHTLSSFRATVQFETMKTALIAGSLIYGTLYCTLDSGQSDSSKIRKTLFFGHLDFKLGPF